MTGDFWGSAAPYERFMGRWSRVLARAVLAAMEQPSGLRWLDVGCGTGALSDAVLADANPESLVGVDPSAEYVAAAASHLQDPRASFQIGDAQSLPLPDDSVDVVVSGLVLNFVSDIATALREMRRVLVPGGTITVYVWDYSVGMQMLRYFWDAAVALDPQAEPLDEGAHFPICAAGALERCVADAHLTQVTARPIEIQTVFRNFDDYWTPFLGKQGPGPSYVASLEDDARERLRARLMSALPTDETDGTIHLSARAWACMAVSPEPPR